jgi:ribosome-associated toxin RatA of RatAB toxin-antitoxin module|tara:strand:+ start:3829 stop:4266 length:438 start_codon:yes stop_codon:yes gene_type:complete
MQVIKKRRRVAFSQEKLFNLVNNTECYSAFIPYCSAGRVIRLDGNIKIAELEFSAMGITYAVRTENHLRPNEEIKVNLVSGPLKRLEGSWFFRAIDKNTTLVELEFSVEFASGVIGSIAAPIIRQVVAGLVDDFCNYANRIYNEH